MKTLLRLEELAQLLVCLGLFFLWDVHWWTYVLLLIGPDIGMLGYLVSPKVGAVTYNLTHHKALAISLIALGFGLSSIAPAWAAWEEPLILTGVVLFGHSCLDRMLGYGLKFGDHFQHTHLGWIGKADRAREQ